MTNINVTRKPFDPGPAAWNELLPTAKPASILLGENTADIVIIGAGFAGLSAARRILQIDKTLKVVVVEARRIAEGPAGRNSGFMIDLPHNLASKDYAGNADNDRQQTGLNRQAIEFAADAVAEYEIPSPAFVRSGKINAAATAKGTRHNTDYSRHLTALDEQFELLDAQQMKGICGSDYYQSGLFTPGTAMLQPALYTRGLAEGLERSGVRIFENSPVVSLTRQQNTWVTQTPNGSVHSQNVVLATNSHVESFGFFKRRLMNIYLYASMTRALSDTELSNLGGKAEWAFTPADPMGTTVRKFTGNGEARIVVRNRFTWAPDLTVSENKLRSVSDVHDRSFARRFPMLGNIDMEYRWGGLLCLSRNAVPAFGVLEPGLFSACCQNGLGTAFGTLSGVAIADSILGKNTDASQYLNNLPEPQKLPPEPFSSIGANTYLRCSEFKAGNEL